MLGIGKKRQQIEELVLEILLSILQTGKPSVVIDKAIEILEKRNQKQLVLQLITSKHYIENGYNLVDAFYYANLLTNETYNYFQLVSKKGTIDTTFVRNYIQENRERKKTLNEMIGLLVMPLVYVLFSAAIGTMLIKQFMNLIMNSFSQKEGVPLLMKPYLFVAHFPLISAVIMIIISAFIVFTVMGITFKKVGYKEFKIFNLASMMIVFRTQKLSYSELFLSLANSEKDKRFKEMYEYASEEVKVNSVANALYMLYDYLDVNTILIFQNYLEKGEDVEGWKYLRDNAKASFDNKMNTLKGIVPMIGYALVAFIIIFSMMPLVFALQNLFNSLKY